MYEIDVDRFKVKPPWRDVSFYVALVWSLALLGAIMFPDAAAWVDAHRVALVAAVAPVVTWLLLHGYIRGKGVEALGAAVAGSRYVDVAGDHRIADTVAEVGTDGGVY